MSQIIIERNIRPNNEMDFKNDSSSNYSLNLFSGGIERGMCVQLTLDWKCDDIQFTKNQLKQFIKDCKMALDKLK